MDTDLARRRTEDIYRLAVEAAPNAMMIVNPGGRILLVNAQVEKLFGYSREELTGRSVDILVPERFRGRHSEQRVEFFARPQVRTLGSGRDLWGLRKDGREVPVEIGLNPVATAEGTLVLASLIDITERKKVEEARLREMNLLLQLGETLQACAREIEAAAAVREYGAKMFPECAGALYLAEHGRNFLRRVSSWGTEAKAAGAPEFQPQDCWALRRGRVYAAEGGDSALSCAHVPRPAPPSLCVPLAAQGETLGILHVSCRNGSGCLGEDKKSLASTVAEQSAMALANLRLRDKLRQEAIRDPLTGLFNRRYLEETLDRELHRCARRKSPLGVIFMDLDRFKEFNDTHGHAAGDAALREVGRLLQAGTRHDDIACRYGGEEFLLILPETRIEDVQKRAEELRQGVGRIELNLDGQSLGRITLSLGVAAFPAHGTSAGALLEAADEALYRAKQEGRDRVATAV